jgi:hypothetical protein
VTWFKVDDGFAFHPKAIAAGNAALGLWLRAGAWCSGNLTDGALPRHMIGTFGAQRRDALRLVEAGLWCETDAGYQFNGWTEWQPTKEQVKADREAAKLRQQAYRERRRNAVTNGATDTVTHAVSDSTPTRPDPTRTSKEVREETSSGEPDDQPEPGPTFDDFYAAYPRKEARRNAEKAWKAATKRATPTDILDGLTRFPFADERRFQPLPASWLNADRWADQTTPSGLTLVQADGTPAHLPGHVVADLIGPDVWSPPRSPDGMTSDEVWEWNRARQLEHIAERQAAARAKLAAGA